MHSGESRVWVPTKNEKQIPKSQVYLFYSSQKPDRTLCSFRRLFTSFLPHKTFLSGVLNLLIKSLANYAQLDLKGCCLDMCHQDIVFMVSASLMFHHPVRKHYSKFT